MVAGMVTLAEIEAAIRASWDAETCWPDERPRWHAGNPARGQCGVTALVVHDLLGGELMLGTVWAGGRQDGYHWWNRFGEVLEVDLTREQFDVDETVSAGKPVVRPPGPPRRGRAEYEGLRDRVYQRLEHGPG
jgi:hypothetical protein